MSKVLVNHTVKMIVGAGKATPTPPVGPALGSKGVKAIDFCKEFNARTQEYIADTPVPVVVTIKPDRTFTFETKSPNTVWLLMKAAGIEKGSDTPGHQVAGTVSLKHIYHIAQIKQTDLRHENLRLEMIAKSVIAVAKSAGINVVP